MNSLKRQKLIEQSHPSKQINRKPIQKHSRFDFPRWKEKAYSTKAMKHNTHLLKKNSQSEHPND